MGTYILDFPFKTRSFVSFTFIILTYDFSSKTEQFTVDVVGNTYENEKVVQFSNLITIQNHFRSTDFTCIAQN